VTFKIPMTRGRDVTSSTRDPAVTMREGKGIAVGIITVESLNEYDEMETLSSGN
jgi:hypothetical protein